VKLPGQASRSYWGERKKTMNFKNEERP